MTNKPRYRYDWKMGWWVNRTGGGTMEIYTVSNPVTEWYRRAGSPVLVEVPNMAYGGGGGGGYMYSH